MSYVSFQPPGGGGGDRAARAERDHGEEVFARLDPRVLRRFFAYVRPYRAILAGAIASVAMFTLAQVGLPIAIRYAVDSALGRSAVPLQTALLFFGGLVCLNAVF